MIETEKLTNVLPASGAGIHTLKDGVDKVYRQWYNSDVENKYGVCAIEMKVID
jgi:ASC-1-like (ASCH) protein